MAATLMTSEIPGGRVAHAVSDLRAMTGRSLRLTRRDPDELVMALVLPISILLLFVYVFGGAMQVGVDYLTYAVPGVILLCAGYGASNTAVAICQDMTSGAMDRFRSMPIVSSMAIAGHVVTSVLKNLFVTALVLLVSVAIGFRPTAVPLAWMGAIGMIVAYVVAITCVASLVGVTVRSPAAASGFGFLMLFLPYVSSAFVPPETMPSWMRCFAEHQPITPVIETLRGLLVGLGTDGAPVTDLGSTAALALGWCIGISLVSATAAAWMFSRRRRH